MINGLLVMDESPTCTGIDDPSASVAFYHRGSDLGETVDVKMDSFAGEGETIDVTGSGLSKVSPVGRRSQWT